MFVSITFHPNRDEWRSLFATQAEAAADAIAFLALFPDEDVSARVEPATVADAAELVERADESHAECSAEAGSGAISLGYGIDGAYAAAAAVPHPADNPLYVAATRFLAANRPAPVAPIRGANAHDDIPF